MSSSSCVLTQCFQDSYVAIFSYERYLVYLPAGFFCQFLPGSRSFKLHVLLNVIEKLLHFALAVTGIIQTDEVQLELQLQLGGDHNKTCQLIEIISASYFFCLGFIGSCQCIRCCYRHLLLRSVSQRLQPIHPVFTYLFIFKKLLWMYQEWVLLLYMNKIGHYLKSKKLNKNHEGSLLSSGHNEALQHNFKSNADMTLY